MPNFSLPVRCQFWWCWRRFVTKLWVGLQLVVTKRTLLLVWLFLMLQWKSKLQLQSVQDDTNIDYHLTHCLKFRAKKHWKNTLSTLTLTHAAVVCGKPIYRTYEFVDFQFWLDRAILVGMSLPSFWGKAKTSPTISNHFSPFPIMQRATMVQLSILTTLTLHLLLSLIGLGLTLTPRPSCLTMNWMHPICFLPAWNAL